VTNVVAQAQSLIERGQPARAAELLSGLIAKGRGGPLARITLGRAFSAAGDAEAALAVLRDACALAPGVAEAALALGEALLVAGHLPTAVAELERAVRLAPDHDGARYVLGCAWLEAGECNRAREILTGISMTSRFGPPAAAKLSEAERIAARPRSPAGYVRHLFDQFSADYDRRMVAELSYCAPAILRQLADLLLPPSQGRLSILDLGCGTGLAGQYFKDLASRLDGVDLSPRMIEKARERGVYDALDIGDLESTLAAAGASYDLILAADTFVYLGDLQLTFAGAHRHLNRQGHLLFTVEKKAGALFELGEKRRYRHSEPYLRAEAKRAGLDVMGLLECSPRSEANAPVAGFAVALQRP
jgi:predicted TPR repeat methyltransferase